jgi:flagellar protein FlbT
MLMDPNDTAAARKLFRQAIAAMLCTYEQPDILAGLKAIDALVGEDRHFEALKTIRGLLPIETAIMAAGTSTITAKAS